MVGFLINLIAVLVNTCIGLAFGFTPFILGCICFSVGAAVVFLLVDLV